MHILTQIIADLSKITPGDLPQTVADRKHLAAVKNIVFNIIGAMTLLIVVVSGFRYIVSGGDPQKTGPCLHPAAAPPRITSRSRR